MAYICYTLFKGSYTVDIICHQATSTYTNYFNVTETNNNNKCSKNYALYKKQ